MEKNILKEDIGIIYNPQVCGVIYSADDDYKIIPETKKQKIKRITLAVLGVILIASLLAAVITGLIWGVFYSKNPEQFMFFVLLGVLFGFARR